MSEQGMETAIGLMSGTSMDGIDAVLIATDGCAVTDHIAFISKTYDLKFREKLKEAVARAHGLPQIPCADVAIDDLAGELTRLHADAVFSLLEAVGLGPSDVRVVGFHGQTVDHRPVGRSSPGGPPGATWQIGNGALLAELTGIDVVGDFRSNDVAHGGQGAPLASVYHRAIARNSSEPVAILNIGGVANVTWIGPGAGDDAPLLAFDVGPGNALIDDWMLGHAGQNFDIDGVLARTGHVAENVLADLLGHPYFDQPPPKSLDRDEFDASPCEGLTAADGAATLTAFTEQAVLRALGHFAAPPRHWYVTGGGRHNGFLMAGLGQLLGVPVDPVEELGINGDALEAEAFAMLAMRSLKGLPISYPETTGAPHPLSGGVLFPVL